MTLPKSKRVCRYLDAVALVGDMESYAYLGEPVGYRTARNILSVATRNVKRIVRPMTQKERIEYGGYGKLPERFKEVKS